MYLLLKILGPLLHFPQVPGDGGMSRGRGRLPPSLSIRRRGDRSWRALPGLGIYPLEDQSRQDPGTGYSMCGGDTYFLYPGGLGTGP